MLKILTFIRQHSLISFLILTFTISWGGILLVVRSGEFAAGNEHSEGQFILMYLAMLVGPSIAGLVLTSVAFGRAGLRDLTSRLFKWRMEVSRYGAALLIAPLAITAVFLTLFRISPGYLPRFFTEGDKWSLLQFSFMAGLMVGFFEELGWTGFAVHTMLKRRYNIITTGLIVGLLFGAWNFLIVFLMSGTPSGAGDLSLVIFLPASLFTWLPTYRVLMVWVYERTGSLLLAMLMYASLIAFWRIFTPLALSGLPLVVFYLIISAVLWIIIAVVLRRRSAPRPQPALPGR